jgi:uncharacterized protein (DUF488 family)
MTELMTIGYEGLKPAEFHRLLKKARVALLVDVRELAMSRRAGFGKTALAEALAREGIGYLHLRSLGCPRSIRHDYRRDCDWARYVRRFSAYLGKQSPALNELTELATQRRCCLLCFEQDYRVCHRGLVARRVVARAKGGLRVRHLAGSDDHPRR